MKQRLPGVEAELAHQVAIIISREMSDPRLGLATVTHAKVTPDLQTARVFVSVFAEQERQREAIACLQHASGFIQHHLAKAMRMKRTPHLVFVLDDSTERAVGLTKLIQDAVRSDSE
ncbi:MAG: hypothetical protein AMXMBFR61_03500 [Fimbriimonadales bacterium]